MKLQEYIDELQKEGRLYFTTEDAIKTFNEPKKNILSRINYFKKRGK